MRLAMLAIVITACGASPEGTFSVVSTRESGNCPTSGEPVTWTVTRSGDKYLLEFTGVTGGCPLLPVNGDDAKLQGKCDLRLADATTGVSTGTAQFSLDFSGDGLTGATAISLPPAKTVPAGCVSSFRVSGKRL